MLSYVIFRKYMYTDLTPKNACKQLLTQQFRFPAGETTVLNLKIYYQQTRLKTLKDSV